MNCISALKTSIVQNLLNAMEVIGTMSELKTYIDQSIQIATGAIATMDN
jgi:hypothetical protein